MSLTKTQQRILYALGHCYRKFERQYRDKPLTVFVSKIGFIDLIKQAEFIQKQERALYKNLEILEKKKLIEYLEKKIRLTSKDRDYSIRLKKRSSPLLILKIFGKEMSRANICRLIFLRF